MKKVLLLSFITASLFAQGEVVCKSKLAVASYIDYIQEENLVGVLQLFENDCKKLDSNSFIVEKFDKNNNITEVNVREHKAYKTYWMLNNNSDKKEVPSDGKKSSSIDIEEYVKNNV